MKFSGKILIILLVLIMVLSLVLTGCAAKFTCDLCQQECTGKQYDLSVMGRGHVCERCYNQICGRGYSGN